MRILIEATAVSAGSGGIVTYFAGLLDGWKQAGFADEVLVVASKPLPKSIRNKVNDIGALREIGNTRIESRILTQQLAVVGMAKKMHADVILCTTPVAPLLAGSTPIVVTVHDLRYLRSPEQFNRLGRTYRQFSYNSSITRAASVIAVSESTARDVEHLIGLNPSRVHVVCHGADHVDRWITSPEPHRHALTFGHFNNKKPETSIAAWSLLRREHNSFDVSLQVVGATKADRERLKHLADSAGVGDLVIINKYLPDPEYQRLFTSAGLILMPSSLEGFGLPIIEAMRRRIPVAVSGDSAMQEIGGDFVLRAPGGTPEEFAAQCERVLFDQSVRDSLVNTAFDYVQRFTWRRAAEQTRQILEAVCR